MEPDRTYITFRLDELRAEAAANRLARASSTRRGDARGACPGWRPPHISVRGIVILVLVATLSVAVATPALAEKPAYPPGRPAPTSSVAPSPSVSAAPSPVPTPASTPTASASPSPTPSVAPSPSAAPSGYPVQYSDSYWEQFALTGGSASNGCWMTVMLNQIEDAVCTAEYDPWWLYPDGTWAQCPWNADPTLPTGWAPEECYDDPQFEGF